MKDYRMMMIIIIIKDFEFKIIEPIVINIPNFKPEIVLDLYFS